MGCLLKRADFFYRQFICNAMLKFTCEKLVHENRTQYSTALLVICWQFSWLEPNALFKIVKSSYPILSYYSPIIANKSIIIIIPKQKVLSFFFVRAIL